MENTLLVALSRQLAMTRQMSVIANNLANMNTAGYKAESALFEEFMMPVAREQSPDKTISFVQDFGLNRNLSGGRLETTDNPLDLAISGDGYFKVETQSGTQYTRDGHLQLDSQGRLVNSSGNPILTTSGSQLTFTTADGPISIASDGTISTDQGNRGKIGLVQFENPRLLQKTGNNLYQTEEPEQPVRNPAILQGALEMSNVQPIVEMTNMIEVLRSYSAAADMVEKADQLERRAIAALGKGE